MIATGFYKFIYYAFICIYTYEKLDILITDVKQKIGASNNILSCVPQFLE